MFALLARAVELDYDDAQELHRTPALDPFRDDPRLAEILDRL